MNPSLKFTETKAVKEMKFKISALLLIKTQLKDTAEMCHDIGLTKTAPHSQSEISNYRQS